MLSPYRAILARPGAVSFSSAGVLARLPMAMVGIAIVLMVQAVYGSYGLAGRVSALYVIAHAVCSPRLAGLVDRHGQARVMRPAIAVATAGMVGLVVTGLLEAPVGWLYGCAVVAGAGIGSIGALVRARWTYILTDARQVHTAYSLESALDEMCFVIGPAAATVLATAVTPSAGLILPALACPVGGYLLLSQSATEPPVHDRPSGVRRLSVLRSRAMIVLALVSVGIGAIFGGTDVAVVAFAQEHGNRGAAGLILAALALGSLLSGLGYGSRSWVSPLWQRFAISTVALAAGVSLLFLVTSVPLLVLVMFVTGFAIAPTLIASNALVQHFVAASRLTEGLTWLGTALGVGVSIGASVGGAMIDRHGARGGFLVVMVSGGFAVLATVVSLRALRARTAQVQDAAAARAVGPLGSAPGPAAGEPATTAPCTREPDHLHSDQVEGTAMGAALAGADLGAELGAGLGADLGAGLGAGHEDPRTR